MFSPPATVPLHLGLFSPDCALKRTLCSNHTNIIRDLTHQLPWGALRRLQMPPVTAWGPLLDIISLWTVCSPSPLQRVCVCVCVTQCSMFGSRSYHMAALMIFMTHSLMHWHTLTSGAPRSPIFPSSRPESRWYIGTCISCVSLVIGLKVLIYCSFHFFPFGHIHLRAVKAYF